MKKKDLDKFKALLEEEKRKILRHLEELSDSSEESMELGTTAGDPADIASAEINQAALQKIGKREAYLLKKIELALRKIEEGTYGECESCGEEIGVARLTARPVAQLCIDCKTEQENNERRFSSRKEEEESEEDLFQEETEEV
ncbi:MAG: TraR/DksA C4-type zinc finger protein [Oligoflexia bacterium]|nr:TraR/DksA C4-type zinc finger protein [Oligoflexia bacterium]